METIQEKSWSDEPSGGTLEPSTRHAAGRKPRFSYWEGAGRMDTEFSVADVKELYASNDTARIFFDYLAHRKQNRSETKVHRIIKVLDRIGFVVNRGDMIDVMKELEDSGCGRFVVGRLGWPSRFVWTVGMVAVGKAAAGEPVTIESLSEGPDVEETLKHSFHLRADTTVSFELPVDLTQIEADRLAAFIKTLPLESEED